MSAATSRAHHALAPEPREPSPDRAPDWVARGTPEPLRTELQQLLGENGVLTRPSDLVRYASDASPYRRFPLAVAQPRDEGEVAELFDYADRRGAPVTFRAAGTSLNGQAQGDGILLDCRRHWRGVEVLGEGEAVRVAPGVILGHVNRLLAPHGRRLGPDPASKDFATVGGVIANNSGGMRCGTTKDSYSTLRSLRFVLPSGVAIDTAAPDAAERFADAAPELVAGLAEIRDEIRSDADLRKLIERKYAIKNTMGYRLSAFLDADEPCEIFRRLLVGSEGTLAFVSEATFETVPVPPLTTTAWVHFPDIATAAAPVAELVEAGATAVEMMVAPALMVAANSIPGTPGEWKELPIESAALLIEFGGIEENDLAKAEARADDVLEAHEKLGLADWTRDPERIELNWQVREGLHGLVGQMRPEGTSLIVEDICVAPERMADCAGRVRELLGEHGFLTGVAGHTSAGNLHFMLTPDFSKPEDRERYDSFLEKLAGLVIDEYGGSLKAEHGTGVNMAPFLEREWGERACELMWRVKELADPGKLLAPGVMLNRDPDCHLHDLKTTPGIEESVRACVECGFCEPACPSRDLTFTPRQRIAVRREIARQPVHSPVRAALLSEYEYDGLDTCAADGSCGLACPLAIDTGALVKELRARRNRPSAERAAERAAERWEVVERGARRGLGIGGALAGALGDRAVGALTGAARRALGAELVPEWVGPMPPPAREPLPITDREGAAAVYVPACINRIFGASHPEDRGWAAGLPEAMVEISRRAGLPVWIPPDVEGTCCGTPWSSKGFAAGHETMAAKTAERLWRWSGEGRLPVVVDATSCTQGMREAGSALDGDLAARHGGLEILDSIEWAERLLPELAIERRLDSVTIHPTCASAKLGLDRRLRALAAGLAGEVVVPPSAGCCGFAGDRGLLRPELTASALAAEAEEVRAHPTDAHLCSNRTCEIGLERETGAHYASFIYVVEELSRPG
ncbi:MAG TPA: FAD-binding and (Fe-S)-binding domain-containing protein [Solirubrobacterales bacterium]|nr:FAD-binding and (Fe-S)-binding domain-containing protein [Solirubrobacterales bacterium]